MRCALIVAFHFPPLAAGSGYLRTLKFCQHLPEHGWRPVVLTAHPRAYRDMGGVSPQAERLEGITVHRAFALDARLHLGIAGRYPLLLALPDRWSSWFIGAFFKGIHAIRRHRPEVILSTYPIATAHLVALALSRATGIPWIADFRDPMIKADYPDDRATLAAYAWIERHTLQRSARSIFTTELARREYQARYPAMPPERFVTVPNGYDEEAFARAEASGAKPMGRRPYVLLHSGYLYPDYRDPGPLFRALGKLKTRGRLSARDLQVNFRGCGNDTAVADLARDHGVDDMVSVLPACAHAEAVVELLEADALLLMQGAGVDAQIPAKLYEYLRARRPILALVAPGGETARTIASMDAAVAAPMECASDIATALESIMGVIERGESPSKPVAECSREARAGQLAAIMDEAVGPAR